MYYKNLEDIWSYRIMIHPNSLDLKKRVIPKNNVFNISINDF